MLDRLFLAEGRRTDARIVTSASSDSAPCRRGHLDLLEVRRVGQHVERAVVVDDDIFGAGLDRGLHDASSSTPAGKLIRPTLLNRYATEPSAPEIAAELRECMPHVRDRPVAVVRQAIDHDRDAAGPVSLVEDFLVVVALESARTALDRARDIVLGHALPLGLVDRQSQARIRVGIAAARARRYRDLTNQFRKQLAAFLILSALAVLDIGPFTMTCHVVRPPLAPPSR